jgi:hypothetical protein
MFPGSLRSYHEAIGKCKKLRVLDLGTNRYLSAFPDAMGELSNLQVLKIILKGVAFIENVNHYFIYDTQVRILLKLGRTEEAYQIVKRTLTLLPVFWDFQEFKKNADYNTWISRQN